MKTCSASYVFREMQITTTVNSITCLFKRPRSETASSNAGEDMEQQELSGIVGGNAKWSSYFGRQSGGFFNIFTYLFTYLAAPGLSCSLWDLVP